MTERDALDQRRPRVHNTAYMGFIAALPCVICMCRGHYRPGVHVAHLRAGSLEHGKRPTGGQEKPSDIWTTPLCPFHHINGARQSQTYYPGGEEKFWADHGINPFELCIALQGAFDAGQPGGPVIVAFAARARKETA